MGQRLRFHYVIVWLAILAISHWRLGLARTSFDEVLAGLTLILCFPASLFVAVAVAAVRINPHFWDTRIGITVGWALFFGAGYAQWFLLLPWLVRKIRSSRESPSNPI